MPHARTEPAFNCEPYSRDTTLADVLVSTAITGTVASVVSGAVLSIVAMIEGKGPLQPINATSHWINGPEAGRRRTADLAHTGIGYATHHASAVFWALPLELWAARRSRRGGWKLPAAAGAVGAAAAILDYGILPRRLAPGWEHALSPTGVAAGFAGLALGLAAGAAVSRVRRQKPF